MRSVLRWAGLSALLLLIPACSASDVAGNLVGSSVGGQWSEVARAAASGPIEMAPRSKRGSEA